MSFQPIVLAVIEVEMHAIAHALTMNGYDMKADCNGLLILEVVIFESVNYTKCCMFHAKFYLAKQNSKAE